MYRCYIVREKVCYSVEDLVFHVWKQNWNRVDRNRDCVVQDTQDRLQQEEDARNQLFQQKKKLEQEVSGLKKDIEDLELSVQKSDQDKATKDHQIRNLNDEIAHQDELINKLNKEKKMSGETTQKTAEELQVTTSYLFFQTLCSVCKDFIVYIYPYMGYGFTVYKR